jgi:hypothetical protein
MEYLLKFKINSHYLLDYINDKKIDKICWNINFNKTKLFIFRN